MSDPIIVAIITGLFVAIPTIISTIVANSKSKALLEYKIDVLAQRVEKHNNVIERMAVQEQKTDDLESRVSRIEDEID